MTSGVYAALGQVWLEAAEEREDPSDVRKALEALAPVASQSTASSETLGHYGRALVLAGQHAQAEQIFREAAQRFPTDPDVLPHYASVAQRLGHLEDARQALLRYSILVDDDRDEDAHAVRIADLSLQLNDAATAVSWYQKSAWLNSADAPLLARFADAQARAGQVDAARATIRRALEKDPDSPSLRAIERRLQSPSGSIAFRIDRVSQTVSEKIEPEHQRRNRGARKNRQVRRVQQVQASTVEHRSPARCGRLNTEPEKAERRLREDRPRHAQASPAP